MKKNEDKILLDLFKDDIQTSKTNKWNTILTDYENYIKEYLKHFKKSLKGNSVSLSKYPYLKVKSKTIKKKLDKAQKKGLLTKKQLQLFGKTKLKIFNTTIK